MEDLITAQEFFDYNGGETDVLGPVQLAISMACTVIENYLKYDPHQKTRVDSFDGDNTDWLLLKAIPVSLYSTPAILQQVLLKIGGRVSSVYPATYDITIFL